MILSKEYLKGQIAEGKARYANGIEEFSLINHNGEKYVSVDRLDILRVDHYRKEE